MSEPCLGVICFFFGTVTVLGNCALFEGEERKREGTCSMLGTDGTADPVHIIVESSSVP